MKLYALHRSVQFCDSKWKGDLKNRNSKKRNLKKKIKLVEKNRKTTYVEKHT